ncbi:hypothetical protein C8Q70DRAFT_518825 [Cubamyces menziesii]|nr:hypothetical protein C8Q70DRAFT_518825 [Cubamyces menziesii]
MLCVQVRRRIEGPCVILTQGIPSPTSAQSVRTSSPLATTATNCRAANSRASGMSRPRSGMKGPRHVQLRLCVPRTNSTVAINQTHFLGVRPGRSLSLFSHAVNTGRWSQAHPVLVMCCLHGFHIRPPSPTRPARLSRQKRSHTPQATVRQPAATFVPDVDGSTIASCGWPLSGSVSSGVRSYLTHDDAYTWNSARATKPPGYTNSVNGRRILQALLFLLPYVNSSTYRICEIDCCP